MLKFKEPSLEDIHWAKPVLFSSGMTGCDAVFGTLYLWRNEYKIKICRRDEFLFRMYGYGGKISYGIPIGKGDIKSAVDLLIEDARARGLGELNLTGVDSENAERLSKLYPGKAEFISHRESADYIYLQSDLALLSGRKYHGKRNHISKFTRLYPSYTLEKITRENIEDALEVSRRWAAENNDSEKDFDGETRAINEAFENFDALGLFGAIMRVDGKPVAMTVAEAVNDEVADIHFEKALSEYQGAYTMLNREFAHKYLSDFKLINREEDLGIEGLRKAKLSYYPLVLLEKSEVVISL